MSGGAAFALPTEGGAERLVHELAARFPLGRRRRFSEVTIFYDTFDWRLYAAGWELRSRRRGDGYELRLEAAGGAEGSGGAGGRRLRAVATVAPAFAADLPDGALAETVRPRIEDRRLLPRVALRRRGESLPLLDARDKTVARLHFEEERQVLCCSELDPDAALALFDRAPRDGDGVPLPSRLVLVPLLGYTADAEPLATFLAGDLDLHRQGTDDLAEALAACRRRPGGDPSKARPTLDPQMPAGEAMRHVYRQLLATLLANEGGVRRRLDPEFLHDFRVAVRRTRAALGQVKGVLPDAEVATFRQGFAWLGRVTGPQRDLDVLQTDLARYREELPEWARRDIAPLADALRARGEAVQAELVAALDSDRYRKLIESWRRFLDRRADGATPPGAGRPIVEVASQRLGTAARRVRRRAAAIVPATPAEGIHRLRIDCKKLRYLLELFSSLYPGGEIGAEVKALKRLQDVLGEHNDLTVQQRALRRQVAEPAAGGDPPATPRLPAENLLAAGYLLARLDDRRARKREELATALERYLDERPKKRERRLFAPPEAAQPTEPPA